MHVQYLISETKGSRRSTPMKINEKIVPLNMAAVILQLKRHGLFVYSMYGPA